MDFKHDTVRLSIEAKSDALSIKPTPSFIEPVLTVLQPFTYEFRFSASLPEFTEYKLQIPDSGNIVVQCYNTAANPSPKL